MEIPESCTECYEIVKSFELVIDLSKGDERKSETYRVDVVRGLKGVIEGQPFGAHYYREQDGVFVRDTSMPWVREANVEDAAHRAISFLASRLTNPIGPPTTPIDIQAEIDSLAASPK